MDKIIPTSSIGELERRVRGGDAQAMLELGICTSLGLNGASASPEKACNLFYDAEEAGNICATACVVELTRMGAIESGACLLCQSSRCHHDFEVLIVLIFTIMY